MNNEVSIIGLGTRGSTLARRRLQGENRVAIWNGVGAKADLLIREDASRSLRSRERGHRGLHQSALCR